MDGWVDAKALRAPAAVFSLRSDGAGICAVLEISKGRRQLSLFVSITPKRIIARRICLPFQMYY